MKLATGKKTQQRKKYHYLLVGYPCDTCDGTGVYEFNAGLFRIDCPSCHGTGIIEKRTREKVNHAN